MVKQKKKRKIDLLFITACISTSLVLLLIGIVALLLLTANDLSRHLKQEMTVEVILKESITDTQLSTLRRGIEASPYCAVCSYISKDDALKDMTKAMGTDPSQFLEYNPFYASLIIRLEADYASNDSIKVIEKKIAAQDGVREVTWQKDLLDIINSNIRKVAGLLLILAMILSLVSFTLINNTIKLTIYAQRFVLYSMKLVGAKWSFIRKPFIRRNLWIGFTSAVLTCIIIWYGLKIGLKYEPWLIMLAEPRIIIPVFAMVTLIGLLITGICALHSVNRFLRMKSGELHYV
ncbi:MAG: permease-like cell division protein FtsX [Bacteroidaceae bacterium]|nr:permease-like cell division protein FtsX [Bacteroidaceae bacterium]MBR6855983.1 permease-like cell division protein FtsX [Bacteroidaceae bacterium]